MPSSLESRVSNACWKCVMKKDGEFFILRTSRFWCFLFVKRTMNVYNKNSRQLQGTQFRWLLKQSASPPFTTDGHKMSFIRPLSHLVNGFQGGFKRVSGTSQRLKALKWMLRKENLKEKKKINVKTFITQSTSYYSFTYHHYYLLIMMQCFSAKKSI